MKRIIAAAVAGLALVAVPASPASATTHFKNCTAMHRVYPGGVARAGAHNRGGRTRYRPHVSTALYNANRKMDRDHDGVACER